MFNVPAQQLCYCRCLLCCCCLFHLLPSEFIRVPARSERPAATVRGLTAAYSADELSPVPLAAQLMGSSTELLAAAARHLVDTKHAPRIDLNCGKPQLARLVKCPHRLCLLASLCKHVQPCMGVESSAGTMCM